MTRRYADMWAAWGSGQPPANLKIYAPNGNRKETNGWLSLVRNPGIPKELDLVLTTAKTQKVLRLNKKAVVLNQDTGEVIYDPRNMPPIVNGLTLISSELQRWLVKNPHWPAILELWDAPVDRDENERIGDDESEG